MKLPPAATAWGPWGLQNPVLPEFPGPLLSVACILSAFVGPFGFFLLRETGRTSSRIRSPRNSKIFRSTHGALMEHHGASVGYCKVCYSALDSVFYRDYCACSCRPQDNIMAKFPEKFPADAFTLENYVSSSAGTSGDTFLNCFSKKAWALLDIDTEPNRFGPMQSSSAELYAWTFRSHKGVFSVYWVKKVLWCSFLSICRLKTCPERMIWMMKTS